MRKAFCIFYIIFAMAVMLTIPASSQSETDCVSGYLEQIIAVAQTDDDSALNTISTIVRDAKLNCETDADVTMLYPNDKSVRLGESDCYVTMGYQRSNTPSDLILVIVYFGYSEDRWFTELWRNEVMLDYYETQRVTSKFGTPVLVQSYHPQDLIADLYRVSIENFDASYRADYGFELTRPGLYKVELECID